MHAYPRRFASGVRSAWSLACEGNADPVVKEKCGPDFDFGASAILRRLPNGQRVLFSGSMDGHMRAYDPETGKVIWDVDTKRAFGTVNKVAARGGSIKGAGVTVAGGWVYFGAGHGIWGVPGNVFLAFGPKEVPAASSGRKPTAP